MLDSRREELQMGPKWNHLFKLSFDFEAVANVVNPFPCRSTTFELHVLRRTKLQVFDMKLEVAIENIAPMTASTIMDYD